ncbi:MAG: hypothetical protein KZQ70_06330 [gamma proteobacterium symbiont of Lucinoma myriamae]|nr:hypothetical protein [gamma proteobacterium symbiont of Lucinoma myriamae]MCU7818049.1 hypothetical protein [gamma proteobacterium symbiont of Lucinoma myriamae]MCU7832121.1 hypothetical protein [gamma proteobacterium symbiont of Lucinoma myriamae]
MKKDIKNEAVLATLLDRFENQRLPRLLEIKNDVDQGETLGDFEIQFLEQIVKDAKQNERYLQTADDELKALMMKVMALYNEITKKALENEQKT